jgi:hypothetical protein
VVLENDLVIEAFAVLEERYTERWKASEARDEEARRQCWYAYKGLEKFRDEFHQMLTDGKIAAAQLVLRDAEQERTKRS